MSCSHSTGEKMTTWRESNLTTALDWQRMELFDRVTKNIHKLDLISKCNNDMEARGVEGHS